MNNTTSNFTAPILNTSGACPASPDTRHCLCVSATSQHAMVGHSDVKCCWCGGEQCIQKTLTQVEGHGPYAQYWKD